MESLIQCIYCKCSIFIPNTYFPKMCSNGKCFHLKEDHLNFQKKKSAIISNFQRFNSSARLMSLSEATSIKSQKKVKQQHYISMMKRARVPKDIIKLLRQTRKAKFILSENSLNLMADLFDSNNSIKVPDVFSIPKFEMSPRSDDDEYEETVDFYPPTLKEKTQKLRSEDFSIIPGIISLPEPTIYPSEGGEYWFNYCGEWKNGNMEGLGKNWYEEGGIYEGSWKNNRPNGNGKSTYSNGMVFDGVWVNGVPNGLGKLYFNGKDFISGNWVDGKLDGNVSLKNEDVELELVFKNGEMM